MNRLTIILAILFSLPFNGFGQIDKKTSQVESISITDSIKLDSLMNTAISDILNSVDSILTIDSLFGTSETKLKSNKLLRPFNWVTDIEDIFSQSELNYFDSVISKFEKETTIEIAIVTIDSSMSYENGFDSLVTMLGRAWGVGKKEKNNGIIIGISKSLRKIRISNGYGIEAKLSNDETKIILDSLIIPEFKQGNYFLGTKNGLIAIMSKLR